MLNRPVIDSDNGIVYNLEKISCALRSGGLRQAYFYCVDISEFSERNTPFTGCPAKGVFVFLRLFGTVTPRREPSWPDRRSGLL